MELVEASSEVMSNREVLDILENYASKKQTNLATILYETTSYLKSSPAASSTLSSVAEFLDAIKEKQYDLSKMEKVQLVNLKPERETELYLIIDNIEEKLTDEQRVELLELIRTKLCRPEEVVQQDQKKVKT